VVVPLTCLSSSSRQLQVELMVFLELLGVLDARGRRRRRPDLHIRIVAAPRPLPVSLGLRLPGVHLSLDSIPVSTD
jgi:hypothetical protein